MHSFCSWLKKADRGAAACCVQVKVFWPAMCKWYAGRVGDYDAQTGRHTILYKDGDVRKLALQHEAVLWTDVPGLDAASLTTARLAAGFGAVPPLVRCCPALQWE